MRINLSNVAHQIGNFQPERLGDPHQGIQGNIDDPAFHFPKVLVAQAGLFGQFLLGQSCLLAIGANLLPDGSTVC